jgi:hypothetical protein
MTAFNGFGVAAVVVTTLAMARPAAADTMLLGSIYDVPPGQVVLAVSTEIVSVAVDRMTPVTINGEPANVADLKPGDRVRVMISRDLERTPIAIEIAAMRRIAVDPLMLLESGAVE